MRYQHKTKLRTTVTITTEPNKDGQSVVTLEIGSNNAATSMFTVIGTAEDPENEDITAAGCNVKVVMAAGSRLYG